jgi:hypothetical protein
MRCHRRLISILIWSSCRFFRPLMPMLMDLNTETKRKRKKRKFIRILIDRVNQVSFTENQVQQQQQQQQIESTLLSSFNVVVVEILSIQMSYSFHGERSYDMCVFRANLITSYSKERLHEGTKPCLDRRTIIECY